MNIDEQMRMQLLMLKGTVSDLPEVDQAKVKIALAELKAITDTYGYCGVLALAMLGCQVSMNKDQLKPEEESNNG